MTEEDQLLFEELEGCVQKLCARASSLEDKELFELSKDFLCIIKNTYAFALSKKK